jgi:ribose 5-phosphate isomerase A
MSKTGEEQDSEALKRAAALRAAGWIEDGMVLGLGTGSTVRYLLDHLAERRGQGEWARLRAVPTSEHTERRAREMGIPILSLDAQPRVDLTIDGADEVDPQLNLIKGLGGALLREKIVASVSSRFVIMADERKRVPMLGTRSALPVEVEPFGLGVVLPALEALGARPLLRRTSGGEPFLTDGRHFVVDCHFAGGIPDPAALEAELLLRPGVLETGLFLGMATEVVIAGSGGISVLEKGAAGGVVA